MIRLLEFFVTYNNLNKTKRFKTQINHTKHIETILKLLISINVVSWYTISKKNKKKIIIFKLNKFKKITPMWSTQKLKLKKTELNKLNSLAKPALIISTTKGLKLTNPYIKATEGGLLVAKIQM